MRVTAVRARRERADIFCRCTGSRPIARVDSASGLHDAPDQREIFLLDLAIVELPRERLVCPIVLGDHDQPGRAAIEPVHDPGPQLAADPAEIRDVVQQRVHQRARRRDRPRGAPPCRPACSRR